METDKRFSYNVNAELYENKFGELAVRLPGEMVYRIAGARKGAHFQDDVIDKLERGKRPEDWSEMAPHELLYGKDWQCIATLGYINGDPEKPAIEFEVNPDKMGPQAHAYLEDALKTLH